MSDVLQPFYELHSANCSLVIDCRANAASILYWGVRLHKNTTVEMLALLQTRQEARGCIEKEAAISLSPEYGAGFLGNAGIQLHSDGKAWAIYTQIKSVEFCAEENRLVISSFCQSASLTVLHELQLDHASDVLSATTEITNSGEAVLDVIQCNAPTIPLPFDYDKITGFEGRWAHEFQLQKVSRFLGSYLRENRSGRTSHDSFPGVLIHAENTIEDAGGVYGLHFGWSGNHRVQVEELASGRAYAQMGELFYPGELQLASHQRYRTPTLYGVYTDAGFSSMSRCFHQYVRRHLIDERMRGKEKLVHFNTWEAMYFDLDLSLLYMLVDHAAEIGVERFVLDDGWFKNRHSDQAALGDWYVDTNVFPDGLGPLIDRVHAVGMEFGLWVEPEMVNPDSDLYRKHPEWALSASPAPNVMFRNQLVLDLNRQEVHDYLFERIDALLSNNAIRYLKWDMNRDLNQPGGQEGRVVTHAQTLAFYGLLERVRKAHPTVEIESCASGGGRADYGVLRFTDRIWTSDSNDAMDRLRIQKGFSFFFPPELMGAHVGPYHCHITDRQLSMTTRAGVAMFGDMGIEANIMEMDINEKAELKAAVALHKKYRSLILGGELVRLQLASYENGFGVVSADKNQALFSYALLASQPRNLPGRYVFAGLHREVLYEVKVIWPQKRYCGSMDILDALHGVHLSGGVLMTLGMQLPIMMPNSILVMHLKAV